MIPHTSKGPLSFLVLLLGEGLIAGVGGGLLALLYHGAVVCAGRVLTNILAYIRVNSVLAVLWFAALMAMACGVGKLMKLEPMISGSGIAQTEGEVTGRLSQNWKKVIPGKFLGGFLCLLGGLSLGQGGPCVQVGAMAGKAMAELLGRDKAQTRHMMTCAAGAGLAVAFNAPLAGAAFALERINRKFSAAQFTVVFLSCITADIIRCFILGFHPVFRFKLGPAFPLAQYGLLVLLGVLCGCMGAFYNWLMIKTLDLYKKVKCFGAVRRLITAFLCAGVLGLVMPSAIGSGQALINTLADEKWALCLILAVFVVKLMFSAVSLGCGAPGGIFFPLLALGALTGCAFAAVGTALFGMNPFYVNHLILFAMAGFFTAAVRAPLTGILLLLEMTGSFGPCLPLSVVSLTAYITAMLLKSEPICDSLLNRFLKNADSAHLKPL